jgi:hypothetical protein
VRDRRRTSNGSARARSFRSLEATDSMLAERTREGVSIEGLLLRRLIH